MTRLVYDPFPLGHDQCSHCGALSKLYEQFPSCRSCTEHACPSCYEPETLHEPDGTNHAGNVICQVCYQLGER